MTQESKSRSILTWTGLYVDVFDPKPEMFVIEDIAHALSMMPRFVGHTPNFYSVAQHSMQVARFVQEEVPALTLEALLHDAAEAYILDIPSPQKHQPEFAGYREVEAKVEAAIQEALGLVKGKHPVIKRADNKSYDWERRVVHNPNANSTFRDMMLVEQDFLFMYYQFKSERNDVQTTTVYS